jgi:hypothetical protein
LARVALAHRLLLKVLMAATPFSAASRQQVAAVVVAAVERDRRVAQVGLVVAAVTARVLAVRVHRAKVMLEAQDRRNLDHMVAAVVAELRRLVRMG